MYKKNFINPKKAKFFKRNFCGVNLVPIHKA